MVRTWERVAKADKHVRTYGPRSHILKHNPANPVTVALLT